MAVLNLHTTEINDVDLNFTCSDVGIGIKAGEIDYICEPFYVASSNQHEKVGSRAFNNSKG